MRVINLRPLYNGLNCPKYLLDQELILLDYDNATQLTTLFHYVTHVAWPIHMPLITMQ